MKIKEIYRFINSNTAHLDIKKASVTWFGHGLHGNFLLYEYKGEPLIEVGTFLYANNKPGSKLRWLRKLYVVIGPAMYRYHSFNYGHTCWIEKRIKEIDEEWFIKHGQVKANKYDFISCIYFNI